MKKKSPLFFLLVFCLLGSQVQGQSYKQDRRFKAALMIGMNLSQVDGDKHSGYDKIGLQGGLRGITILNDELELSFELLFSQKGSKSKDLTEAFNRPGARKPLNMRLNYMEVPVLINYRIEKLDRNFYKFELHGGLSYSRLLNYSISEVNARVENETVFNEIAQFFSRNDISLILGTKVNFSPHVGFALRHTVALNKFYHDPDALNVQIKGLRNYHFSLLTIYSF